MLVHYYLPQFLFQPLSPTSHTPVTLLSYHNFKRSSVSKHINRCQHFTMQLSLLLFQVPPRQNQWLHNSVAPSISCKMYTINLSYSFHAPLNPHTSIPYVISDSHTISYRLSSIITNEMGGYRRTFSIAFYPSVSAKVLCSFQPPVPPNVTPTSLNLQPFQYSDHSFCISQLPLIFLVSVIPLVKLCSDYIRNSTFYQ
jgi:hypothetical protein